MTESEVQNTQRKLIEEARQNSRVAQSQLYELYYKAIFNSSLRIVGDYYVAEDLMQDAFIDGFKNINGFEGSSTFGAWLKKIVINKSINHIRKEQLIADKLEDYSNELEEIEESEQDYSVEEVKKAIKLLSPNYKVVFSLYLIEGYDHEEIAQIMSISPHTSRSQLSRAKRQLKKIIETDKHQVI